MGCLVGSAPWCFCAYVMVGISTMALFKWPWPRPQNSWYGVSLWIQGYRGMYRCWVQVQAQCRLSSHSKSKWHPVLPWWFLFLGTERLAVLHKSSVTLTFYTFRNVYIWLWLCGISIWQGCLEHFTVFQWGIPQIISGYVWLNYSQSDFLGHLTFIN